MSKSNVTELLRNIATKGEAMRLLYELQSLKDSMYETNTTLAQKIRQRLSLDSEVAKDVSTLKIFIDRVAKIIKTIPVVTIIVAVDFSPQLKQKITQYLLKILDRKVFIEIEKKPELIGGAAVIYLGKYREFSIASYLEGLYQKYL